MVIVGMDGCRCRTCGVLIPTIDQSTTQSAKGASAGGGSSGVGSNTANQGRISKWVGDLSLLAGSPQDAIEAYAVAIGECKV